MSWSMIEWEPPCYGLLRIGANWWEDRFFLGCYIFGQSDVHIKYEPWVSLGFYGCFSFLKDLVNNLGTKNMYQVLSSPNRSENRQWKNPTKVVPSKKGSSCQGWSLSTIHIYNSLCMYVKFYRYIYISKWRSITIRFIVYYELLIENSKTNY